MSDTPSNAVFVIAAISVILFSVVGVGVMTGVIPSAVSKLYEPQVAAKPGHTETVTAATSPDNKSDSPVHGKAPVSDSTKQNADTKRARAAPVSSGCINCGRVEMVRLAEQNNAQRYDVLVRLEDGTTRTFSYDAQPMFRAGDKVKVVEGILTVN